MTPVLAFTAPGKPVSTNHGYKLGYRGKRPCLLLSQEGAGYKNILEVYARVAWKEQARPDVTPLDEDTEVRVRFWFESLRPDVDGPCKFVLDALQAAGVLRNDVRVRRLVVEKCKDAENPRTEVQVFRLAEPEAKRTEKP